MPAAKEKYPTRQDMFNRVWDVFVTQGAKQCMTEDGGVCLYSHKPNGFGCAVGCLLDPEVAEQWDKLEEDGVHIAAIHSHHAEDYLAQFNPEDTYFLMTLQNAHDYNHGAAAREEALRKVAEEFNLTIPQ